MCLDLGRPRGVRVSKMAQYGSNRAPYGPRWPSILRNMAQVGTAALQHGSERPQQGSMFQSHLRSSKPFGLRQLVFTSQVVAKLTDPSRAPQLRHGGGSDSCVGCGGIRLARRGGRLCHRWFRLLLHGSSIRFHAHGGDESLSKPPFLRLEPEHGSAVLDNLRDSGESYFRGGSHRFFYFLSAHRSLRDG